MHAYLDEEREVELSCPVSLWPLASVLDIEEGGVFGLELFLLLLCESEEQAYLVLDCVHGLVGERREVVECSLFDFLDVLDLLDLEAAEIGLNECLTILVYIGKV